MTCRCWAAAAAGVEWVAAPAVAQPGLERDPARAAARPPAGPGAGVAGSRTLNIRTPEKAPAAAGATISTTTFLFKYPKALFSMEFAYPGSPFGGLGSAP